MRFGGKDREGVVVVMRFEVVDKESVADFPEEVVVDGSRGSTLLELVNYFLPQLQLNIVYQVLVLPKRVQQFLFVKVLFVHRYPYYIEYFNFTPMTDFYEVTPQPVLILLAISSVETHLLVSPLLPFTGYNLKPVFALPLLPSRSAFIR